MSTFLLEIITPERIAFSDQVEMIVVPGSEGVLGILPGHIPLFASLTEGEIKIVRKGEEYFLAIGSGFLEVSREKVIVLVTAADHQEEINEEEVLNAKKRAEEILSAKPTGAALSEAQALFKRSMIALKVLQRKRRSPIIS